MLVFCIRNRNKIAQYIKQNEKENVRRKNPEAVQSLIREKREQKNEY